MTANHPAGSPSTAWLCCGHSTAALMLTFHDQSLKLAGSPALAMKGFLSMVFRHDFHPALEVPPNTLALRRIQYPCVITSSHL